MQKMFTLVIFSYCGAIRFDLNQIVINYELYFLQLN